MNTRRQAFLFIGWYFFFNSLLFEGLGFDYLKSIVLNESVYQNSIADYSGWAGKVLVLLFALGNYAWFMIFLAFLPAIFVILLATCWPKKSIIVGLSILLAWLSIILLIIDTRVFMMFRFHLNANLLPFLVDGHWGDLFEFSTQEIKRIVAQILVIFMAECGLAWLVSRYLLTFHRFRWGPPIAISALGCSIFCYFTLMLTMAQNNNLFSQQLPNLPLYNQLLEHLIPDPKAKEILLDYTEHHFSQPLFSNDPVNYPLHPLHCTMESKPYNVILILVDSLRADCLQNKYMPALVAFGKKSWVFSNHLSGGNATQPGVFSLFYSIPGNYWTAMSDQKIPPVLMDLFRKNSYLFQTYWAVEMQNPSFDRTVFLGVPHLPLEGAPFDDAGDKDRFITKQAIQFLMQSAQSPEPKPFFLNVFYNAPHAYCRAEHIPPRFQPIEKQCSRMAMTNETDREPYFNRYLNTVSFVDQEIDQLLKTIDDQGLLKNSIVIITADHGQAFNENHRNDWGHAGSFTPAQLEVPLIIHWPEARAHEYTYRTSSYDLVPTLLTHLFHCNNPTIDYSMGQDLLEANNRLPFVLVGSYVNMGIVEPDRVITLQKSGRVILTTPDGTPIANEKLPQGVLKSALAWMRKYFV